MPSPKTLAPLNDRGSIRLRFTVNGKRYSLSAGGPYGDRRAMGAAEAVAALIELDLKAGIFDETLTKYRDRLGELTPLGKSESPRLPRCYPFGTNG